MTPRGGAREGAGRPPRKEPKSLPIWCGQMSEDDRKLILERLTPQERYDALMGAVKGEDMDVLERILNHYDIDIYSEHHRGTLNYTVRIWYDGGALIECTDPDLLTAIQSAERNIIALDSVG